ncbi:protein of unknown function [Burkholderia multivorans]
MDALVHGLIDAVNGVLWNYVLIALMLGMVMFGSVGQLPLVWAMADTSMGLMAIINLIAILVLGKYAHAAWRDYRRQRADGIADPVFTRHTIPELARVLPADVWGEHGPLPQRAAAASDTGAASGVAVRRS